MDSRWKLPLILCYVNDKSLQMKGSWLLLFNEMFGKQTAELGL